MASDWSAFVLDDSNQPFPLNSDKDSLSKFITKRDLDIQEYISENDDQFLKISNSTTFNFYSNINQYMSELVTVLQTTHKQEESLTNKKIELDVMQDHVYQMDKIIALIELYNKGNQYLQDSVIFKALGTYKQVKQSPLIKRHLFLKQLINLINNQESLILSKANALVKEWLVVLRQSAPAIGKKGIELNKQMQSNVTQNSTSNFDIQPNLPDKLTQLWQSVQDMNFLDISGLVYAIKEIHDSDLVIELVDFTPLFKTIYTYDLLDSKSELIRQFESDRSKQADLLIPHQLTLKNLDNTFHDIVGFYLIEEEILRQTSQFRTKNGVDTLWKQTQTALDIKLKLIIENAETSQLIEIKNKLSIFAKTIELYGFSSNNLESFNFMFELFCERMKTACSSVLLAAIEEDNYSPYVVTDGKSLKEICKVIPLNIEDYLQFPCEMPFSQQVVTCSRETLNFTTSYLLFLDDQKSKRSDIDEILKSFLDNLFVFYINSPLKTEALKSNNLTQLTVIWKNLIFYSFICKNLQLLLIQGKISTKSHGIRLTSILALEETRQLVELKLEKKVYERIGQFLELSNYELTPRVIEPTSSYIKDLTRFLEDILGSVFGIMKSHLKPGFFQQMLDLIVDYILVKLIN